MQACILLVDKDCDTIKALFTSQGMIRIVMIQSLAKAVNTMLDWNENGTDVQSYFKQKIFHL